ncbi:hypothetical protein [Prosthecobacter algae]|uniref:hypothetical protein n=1 Tax=Prosthecobacter algae TaxID=1144682 RepID=UPI0031EF7484
MKKLISTSSWIALLAITVSANGQGPLPEIPGTVSSVTISLAFTTTVDGTVKKSVTTGRPLTGTDAAPTDYNYWAVVKDGKRIEQAEEVVTKMLTSKYSNKEFLLDLKDANVITDIKGWSVTKVQATIEGPEVTAVGRIVNVENGPVRLYLTHKTLPSIPIDEYISVQGLEAETAIALALNSKRLAKYNAQEVPTSDVTTHNVSLKSMGFVRISFSRLVTVDESEVRFLDELQLTGASMGGEKLGFYGPRKLQVLVPAAGKLGPLVGFYQYYDPSERDGFVSRVEGSVSLGAGVVKNVGVFPDVTVDPDPENVQ